ncbi:UNVERIFIED_ORG: hypothetical protein J2X79_001290 [Arthrobacter globiformis]|nr:hypothetical protein [Arthrobacter globiformis]
MLLAPAAVLLSGALTGADPTLLALGAAVGVLAAAVQSLGLIRWPFLVPYLARTATDPDATEAAKKLSTSSSNPSTAIWAWPSASIWATCSAARGAYWPAWP